MPGACTLLLVDDDRVNLIVLQGLLERRARQFSDLGELRIITAADGRQAVARLAAGGVDAMFLDIMMPELDGFGVLEWMRETRNRTPVVVVTAGDEAMRQRIPPSQVVSILIKPVSEERLAIACDALQEMRFGLGPSAS